MAQTLPPPGWHPDPSGQHGLRYWDGAQWTDQTQDAPFQQPGPPPPQSGPHGPQGPQPGWGTAQGYAPDPVRTNYTPDRIQRQVREEAGVHSQSAGTGSLFTEPVLVVNQKTKLIELTNEYAVFDQQGNQIGSVVEVGQGAVKKAVRALTSWDQFLTHRLEVRDRAGVVQMLLTRPAKVFKSRVVVTRPDGAEIGSLVQRNVFGKINFALMSGEQQIGMLKAENWRAWNFSLVDHTDTEVARVTKTWEGLARTLFTSADNYVVQIHRPLADPLLSLVVAAALTIDTALKQDSRGFN